MVFWEAYSEELKIKEVFVETCFPILEISCFFIKLSTSNQTRISVNGEQGKGASQCPIHRTPLCRIIYGFYLLQRFCNKKCLLGYIVFVYKCAHSSQKLKLFSYTFQWRCLFCGHFSRRILAT